MSTGSKSFRKKMSVPELEDERQAMVLYSPFRDKSLNPHSWTRKMKFWEGLLQKTFMEQRVVSFNLDSLPEMFERNGLTPKCLSTVVEQMKSLGQIRPIADYKKTSGWLSWGFNTLVKQPLYWGVTQLIGSHRKQPDVFVSPEVVEATAKEILELHQSHVRFGTVDTLVSLSQLRELCQELTPSDQDFEIVLTHLERENQIALRQVNDRDVVVKFSREGEADVTVREIDLNIYSIKSSIEKLEKEISILSSKVDEQLMAAKRNVKEGRKRMAVMNLRRKASTLRLMERKAGSLTILQDIVLRIEDASTNEMVLKACEAGVRAMKSLNEDATAERAEAVMDDWHEATSTQGEVSDLLGSLASATGEEDEEELEKALAELLEDGSRDQEKSAEPVPHSPPSMPSLGTRPLDSPHKSAQRDPELGDIAEAFLSLQLEDSDLPEVPSQAPSAKEHSEEKKGKTPLSTSAVPSS